MISKHSAFVFAVTLTTSTINLNSASAGTARSMSPSYSVTDSSGNSVKERLVNCSNTTEKRVIRLNTDINQWCASPDFTNCSSQKIQAANKACDNKIATTNQPSEVESRSASSEPVEASTTSVQTQSITKRQAMESELAQIKQKQTVLQQRLAELEERSKVLQARLPNQ